ncbi:hypothetical protein [Agarivorans sp. DSG3-1]|uniref:hypothetical protein n=1 Tax=Agarivorans sp. DSG3-1 TaxID=3342249 RepID=UPI00398F76BB
MSYVLSIHSALRTIFSERKNFYGFMKMVNINGSYFGNTPLSIISTGSLDDLEQLANHMVLLSKGTITSHHIN